MMIHMDPDIAQIFKQSSSVSMSKGTSSFLMKATAKRRRTRLEIEEDKQQEIAKKTEIEQKLNEYEQLKQHMEEMQQRIDIANKVESQFHELASQGRMKMD